MCSLADAAHFFSPAIVLPFDHICSFVVAMLFKHFLLSDSCSSDPFCFPAATHSPNIFCSLAATAASLEHCLLYGGGYILWPLMWTYDWSCPFMATTMLSESQPMKLGHINGKLFPRFRRAADTGTLWVGARYGIKYFNLGLTQPNPWTCWKWCGLVLEGAESDASQLLNVL